MENPFEGIGVKAMNSVRPPKDIPNRLWHYTSTDGAIGIIGESKIWFTDAAYMNDGSELRWGLQILDSVRKELSKDLPNEVNSELSIIQEEALRLLSFHGALVFCMCEKPNLLNQWRYYGRDIVPYSIGFDPVLLCQKDLYNFNSQLVRMEYNKKIQKDVLKKIIDTVKETLTSTKNLSDDDAQKIRRYAAYEFLNVLMRFKHSSFESELEWRLVTQYTELMKRDTKLRYRSSNLGVVPYVEMKKIDDSEKNLPIREVCIGPTPFPDVSKLGLNSFLSDKNYDYVRTFQSTIPLRQ